MYGIERQQPVVGALGRSTTGKTYTDSAGRFSLPQAGQTLPLVFAKPGYTTDTVQTISLQSGEFLTERFEGEDTVNLFRIESYFRDSIYQLNMPRP